MNKFVISHIEKPTNYDENKPSLYKVYFGPNYILHKGKKLEESVDRLLDDVFRGTRDKKSPDVLSEVVKYCRQHPSLYRVSVEVVLNGDPDKILRKEKAIYKSMANDPQSLNRLDIEPYTPEWMLKQSLQKRCESCAISGVIDNKKTKFKFCPHCGRLNK